MYVHNKENRIVVDKSHIIFQVQLDESDTVSSMIPGYPTHNRQNEKDIFYLRFPKFASYLVYDPYGCLTCDIEVGR